MELSPRADRRGASRRVRPGAWVSVQDWETASERDRHLVRVRAAARALTPRAVLSHESAAAIHGIPVLAGWPDVVRASYAEAYGMSARAGVRFTRARWADGDVVDAGRLRMTSLRRTAVDLARTGGFAQGVEALDHVLAHGVERVECEEWLRAQRSLKGIARLRRALQVAQGQSESPLESLSLARFAELGVAAPVQQYAVRAGASEFRVDFFWPQQGVVGEADGRVKYSTGEDLWREKRREDAIRSLGLRVIRWSWSDAWTVEPLRVLLRSAGLRPV